MSERAMSDVDPQAHRALLDRAIDLTGIEDPAVLVRLGLEALVTRESARRLATLGGSEPELESVSRRRPGAA